MATDLGNHLKSRDAFRQQLAAQPSNYDKSNSEHRLLLLDAVMTCCDLCATALPEPISHTVVVDIFEEFFLQGEEERQLGHTPGPMYERVGASVGKLQRDFIDFIPIAAYRNLSEFFPQLGYMLKNTLENRDYWDQHA